MFWQIYFVPPWSWETYAAYTSFTAYTQDDETENVTKIKSCFPGWKMTRCFDGWWHDVIWETGTLSNCQLALEFFLLRFLLTLVKRNLDDRQFTSWIKEVNRSADSLSLFQNNHWKPYHYFHPNHWCGHKNLSITAIINHILSQLPQTGGRANMWEGHSSKGKSQKGEKWTQVEIVSSIAISSLARIL